MTEMRALISTSLRSSRYLSFTSVGDFISAIDSVKGICAVRVAAASKHHFQRAAASTMPSTYPQNLETALIYVCSVLDHVPLQAKTVIDS